MVVVSSHPLTNTTYLIIYAATHCNTLQHAVTRCHTLQIAGIFLLTRLPASYLHHTPWVTHCNTLQHTATHCNTLQHTAPSFAEKKKEPKHIGSAQKSAPRECLCIWATNYRYASRGILCWTKSAKMVHEFMKNSHEQFKCVMNYPSGSGSNINWVPQGHHPLRPVIKLGFPHQKKERKRETRVTVDRDKIEVRLLKSSSIFNKPLCNESLLMAAAAAWK